MKPSVSYEFPMGSIIYTAIHRLTAGILQLFFQMSQGFGATNLRDGAQMVWKVVTGAPKMLT